MLFFQPWEKIWRKKHFYRSLYTQCQRNCSFYCRQRKDEPKNIHVLALFAGVVEDLIMADAIIAVAFYGFVAYLLR